MMIMNGILKIFFTLLMLTLIACNDETNDTNVNREQEIRIFASAINDTRVSFEQDGNVTHAFWEKDDKIGIYGGEQKNLGYLVSEKSMHVVEFKPENEILKGMDGTSVVAYYPFSNSVQDRIVPLPNTSNFVWSEMTPFIYATDVVENGSVSLRFKHTFAYLKLTFTKDNMPEWTDNDVLNRIEISVEGGALGIREGFFSLNDLKQTMISTTSTIIVDAELFDLNKADFSCYVPILPQEAAQVLTFKFMQNNDALSEVIFECSKKTSEEGILPGYVYEVALNNEELPMSSEALKKKIDQVGKNFVNNFKATEFNDIKNTIRYIKDTFCKNSESTDVVTTWYEQCLEAITESSATRDTTISYKDSWHYATYISEYYYHYTDLIRVYAASQFVGHFTIKGNKWVKESGDFSDMQFTAPDENGDLCTLKLSTKGETKKVYIGDYKSEDWYNWNEERRDSIMYEYFPTGEIDSATGLEIIDTIMVGIHDIYKYSEDVDINTYMNYVYIPEQIILEYTQGDTPIFKTDILTNHSSLKSDQFDIASEDLEIEAETHINGFDFVTKKFAYDAGKNIQNEYWINKSGVNLLKFSAVSDLTLSGDVYDENVDVDDCRRMFLNMDIMHQMQIKFFCEDALNADELMDLAKEYNTNETYFKEQLSKLNQLMTGGLYFDGQATKQAWVTMEPFQYRDWYDEIYWDWDIVMNFSDGSSYSTFSDFFNEDDFRSLINISWDVMDDFANLLNQLERDF